MRKVFWGVLIFSFGVAVGWAASRQFTPDWVGAIGTWIGAAGTIAAIVWAVHTFQEDRRREAEEKATRELALAQGLTVRCFGGGGHGLHEGHWWLDSVHVEVINAGVEPVSLLSFSLPGVALQGNVMAMLPPSLPQGESKSLLVDLVPNQLRVPEDEISKQKPLAVSTPIIRYQVGGITWERTGDEPPRRLG